MESEEQNQNRSSKVSAGEASSPSSSSPGSPSPDPGGSSASSPGAGPGSPSGESQASSPGSPFVRAGAAGMSGSQLSLPDGVGGSLVRIALLETVAARRVAQVVQDALEAEDVVSLGNGKSAKRPNWTARLKAAEFWRDTVDGCPAKIEIKENRSISIDTEDALFGLMQKSPKYRKKVQRLLDRASNTKAGRVRRGPGGKPWDKEDTDSGGEGSGEEGRTNNPPFEDAEFEVVE